MQQLPHHETSSVHAFTTHALLPHPNPKYDDFMGVPQLPYESMLSTSDPWLGNSSPLSHQSLSSQSSPMSTFGDVLSVEEVTQLMESSSLRRDPAGLGDYAGLCQSSLHYSQLYDDFSYSTQALYDATRDHTTTFDPDWSSSSPVLSAASDLAIPTIQETTLPGSCGIPLSHVCPSEESAAAGASYQDDSDLDAEGETDKEDGSDDEYTPPSLPTLTQRRSYRKTRSTTASSSNRVLNHSPPKSPRPSRPTKPAPVGRSSRKPSQRASRDGLNETVPFQTASRSKRETGVPNYNSTNEKGDFVCESCGRVCLAHRRVDFKRHVNTHYPHMVGGPVICCGVPLEEKYLTRHRKNIDSDGEVMVFYGRQMVGGCGKIFSRTDALRRHLDLASNTCVGDLNGDWHPPKQLN